MLLWVFVSVVVFEMRWRGIGLTGVVGPCAPGIYLEEREMWGVVF